MSKRSCLLKHFAHTCAPRARNPDRHVNCTEQAKIEVRETVLSKTCPVVLMGLSTGSLLAERNELQPGAVNSFPHPLLLSLLCFIKCLYPFEGLGHVPNGSSKVCGSAEVNICSWTSFHSPQTVSSWSPCSKSITFPLSPTPLIPRLKADRESIGQPFVVIDLCVSLAIAIMLKE